MNQPIKRVYTSPSIRTVSLILENLIAYSADDYSMSTDNPFIDDMEEDW